MDRNNNTRRRGPKGNKKVANTYRKTYKTASSAAVAIKPITHIKKIKKSGKTYQLVTVTAEYTDANKRKYESEGFTEKAQLTRELRRGKKSMGIWQLLKEVVGNSNMNNIANMFAAINLSKESSPVIEKMAQIEVDEALGDLSSMFSSRFRF
jgi:hypothetical protein